MEGRIMNQKRRQNTPLMSYEAVPKTYDQLLAMHPLRPIHNDVELDHATTMIDIPHSTELCGGASPAFVIPLQLSSFIPILDHPLQRLPDLRVIHAKHRSPDPRKPDHHRGFSERIYLLSTAW